MFCSKCGKEIKEGNKEICDECKKEKKKLKINYKILILVILIIAIAVLVFYFCVVKDSTKVGNTIGNIRNYGYITKGNGNNIYFVAPNDAGNKMCIYKSNLKGENKKVLLEENWDILGINYYKNNLYFIAIDNGSNSDEDVDNKIYKMKTDGSNLQVINDNQFDDDSYEIYVVNNKIYYIGNDYNIYSMYLNGENKNIVSENGTGFIGITDKYIFYNKSEIIEESEEDTENIVTYYANLDGTNEKAITGERLYSINVLGDDIYYVDADKKMHKTNLNSGDKTLLSEDIKAYNMNIFDNKIYYMNYCDEEYNVAIYRCDLDGNNEEELLVLDNYSTFLGVIKNEVMYMDNNEERGVINLLNGDNQKIANLYEYVFELAEENLDVTDTTSAEDTTN